MLLLLIVFGLILLFRGSAIARIVGATVKANSNEFDQRVNMWVFEELVDGKKLSEIINTQHENIKYLPGKKLPNNIVGFIYLICFFIYFYIFAGCRYQCRRGLQGFGCSDFCGASPVCVKNLQ